MLSVEQIYNEFVVRATKAVGDWKNSWNHVKLLFKELCKKSTSNDIFLHYLTEFFIVVGNLFEECDLLIYGILRRPWQTANNANMILQGKYGSFEGTYKGSEQLARCRLTVCSAEGLTHQRKEVSQLICCIYNKSFFLNKQLNVAQKLTVDTLSGELLSFSNLLKSDCEELTSDMILAVQGAKRKKFVSLTIRVGSI